jgi:chemotaxis methyl-accepting protein methylase/signal transduction histidine kinase
LAVVGIGTSAGGLESLKEFFAAMPADSGMAFVVIQHLDPTHVSYMADLLAKYTEMKVLQAEDGTMIEADTVYTIPPNKFLMIRKGMLHLTEPVKNDGVRMPIDFLFRSLAEDQHEKAICMIFSGSGSDGTIGLREVRGAGGMTIVQEPETAQFDAMLRSAIATGMVDFVLPLREIPGTILRYARQSYMDARDGTDREQKLNDVDAILKLLSAQTRTDFAPYKKNTVLRRIERRMGLRHIPLISDYVRFLQENPEEVRQLSKDLLINVSSFFRDAEAFEELRHKAIAPLVREKENSSPLRVWVPGCATGEEAYSIAILLLEELSAAGKNCAIQLFASDVDGDCVKFAREGVYPQTIAADVSEERLKRFFTKQDSRYQVSKQVRELVIFSVQNLISEAPFSKLDLISCRNVLIYIEPNVQRRIISLLAFALSPGGYLFLGKSDGMAAQTGLFTTISQKRRLYRRDGAAQASPADSPFLFEARRAAPVVQKWQTLGRTNLSELNQQVLLKYFDASVVLIDEKGNILNFYGPTRKYLEHPTGEPSLNLLNMVENRISAKFRLALRKAAEESEPVTMERVQFGEGDSGSSANVTVMPILSHTRGDRLLAVIFEEASGVPDSPNRVPGKKIGEDESLVAQLESELKVLKAEFQATIDEYESSAEELKAANEEILSINEELQSTNEELETSKEEIQAINEELNTVNSELNSKVDELTEVNNDLVNFLNSSEIGTIFLDNQFRIKRFTPSAGRLMNLISSDLGRPVSHMAHKFVGLDLVADAERVLASLSTIEKEIQSSDGQWYAMHCLPYRTLDNRIDGVIFTFADVTRLKRSEESMQEARNYAQDIVETVSMPLVVLDGGLRVVSANRTFYQTFRVEPQDTKNRSIYELGSQQWDIAPLRQLLEDIVLKETPFNDFEVDLDFPGIGRRTMLLNARRISRGSDRTQLILLAIEDFTERKRAEELLKSEAQLRQKALELEQQLIASGRLVSLGEITASMAHEFNNPLGIVMGFIQDLLAETDASHPNYRALKIMDEESRRCRKIIQDLMEYARPRSGEFDWIKVKDVIEKTLSMVQSHLYKRNVQVINEAGPDVPRIYADAPQLEQVLLNLYLNAIDAMPEGGTLTVAVEVNSHPADETGRPTEVMITVADTGVGIESGDLPKIFQPFFTAKKKSGLGLGLAICDRIVKNHGGRIEMESRPEQGTTFRIYFPLERQAETGVPSSSAEQKRTGV